MIKHFNIIIIKQTEISLAALSSLGAALGGAAWALGASLGLAASSLLVVAAGLLGSNLLDGNLLDGLLGGDLLGSDLLHNLLGCGLLGNLLNSGHLLGGDLLHDFLCYSSCHLFKFNLINILREKFKNPINPISDFKLTN